MELYRKQVQQFRAIALAALTPLQPTEKVAEQESKLKERLIQVLDEWDLSHLQAPQNIQVPLGGISTQPLTLSQPRNKSPAFLRVCANGKEAATNIAKEMGFGQEDCLTMAKSRDPIQMLVNSIQNTPNGRRHEEFARFYSAVAVHSAAARQALDDWAATV